MLLASTIAVVAVACVGFVLSWVVAHSWAGQPGRSVPFFYLYGRYERPFFLLLGFSTVATALYASAVAGRTAPELSPPGDRWPRLTLVAVVVVVVTSVGCQFALHGFPLSMDEFNAVFQSHIFAEGRTAAPVPEEWRALIPVIKPLYVTYRADDHTWLSGYLPVYAAIRAVFLTVGLDWLVNPLLGGLAVLAVGTAARQLWPSAPDLSGIAALLLASSTQFLLTSMTFYSMPAHLLANLAWLVLYLRGGTGLLIAPWIGALAMGLHNPLPHVLFVAPFIVRLVRDRRWRLLAYFGGVYAIGAATWLAWWGYALPAGSSGAMASLFGTPTLAQLLIQSMSISLALAWQAPLVGLGVFLSFAAWNRLPPVERDLLAGLLLTCGFYVFFLDTQVHGWGYRYLHPVLGSVTLLAARGLALTRDLTGERGFGRLLLAAVLVAVAVQLPLRLREAEEFVRPWARGHEYISELDAPVVGIPSRDIWMGGDLVRNSPFLLSPVTLHLPASPEDARRLEGQVEGLTITDAEDLAAFGLVTTRRDSAAENPVQQVHPSLPTAEIP